VLEKSCAGLGGQVQAAEVGIADLQEIDDPQALAIVIEPTVFLEQEVQAALARVAEGGVSEIVGQCDRLGELLVDAQRARDGARNLAGSSSGTMRPSDSALFTA
jgi:hypothetical protein